MPPSRRLVRRRPLIERLKAYLNPLDFLLWLSEELETSDWERWQKSWSIPIGAGINLAMIIARSNSTSTTDGYDAVFGDSSSSLVSWFATFVVHFLSIFSFANAAYTFYRRRNYRLFEASIDERPSTPSAQRVKVESSPLVSSPLKLLNNIVSATSAASRAHPDPKKDVWEVAMWDPTPLCLSMFCLFSPGHVLVYWLFLPTAASDAQPSVTVFKTLALATLLSVQLLLLQSNYSQQAKDAALIHKEVLHEYDIKYVHPRTHPVMRDVGTQFSGVKNLDGVDEYRPVTVVNPGFKTKPNPNYVSHVDPDAWRGTRDVAVSHVPTQPSPSKRRDFSSPAAPMSAMRPSVYRASMGSGDGGSLGVYSHAQSPLRKAASTSFAQNQRLARVQQSPLRRESGRF